MREHITRVDRFKEPMTLSSPDSPSLTRYVPRCTCGWVGDGYDTPEAASGRADLHRRNAALAALAGSMP